MNVGASELEEEEEGFDSERTDAGAAEPPANVGRSSGPWGINQGQNILNTAGLFSPSILLNADS